MDIHRAQSVVSIAVLLILSFQDIKRREISGYLVIIYGLSGIVIGMFKIPVMELLLSAVPGAFLLILGRITDEGIGYGDGLVILALGIWVGLYLSLVALIVGILLLGIVSLGYVLMMKIKREKVFLQTKMPFMPFLLSGLVVSICV